MSRVLVVESDKADMDVESFQDGYLAAVLMPAGSTATVGETIGLIVENEDEIASVQDQNAVNQTEVSNSDQVDLASKKTEEKPKINNKSNKNEEGIVGVPTGLTELDDRLGGLHKSDLVIIAGRPSMGKTALATNIAFNAAKNLQDSGKESTIAFFSLEMSSEQLSTRIISEQARISSNDIRQGRITDEQFDKFLETTK